MVAWNHAVVVRELALDQLGHELHAAKGELGLVVRKLHFDAGRVLATHVTQQALQLQQEQNKQVRKRRSRAHKQADAKRLYALKQQQKREKHKGH